MMNEFPPKYFEVMRECSGSGTPTMNVTEYLERLRRWGSRRATCPLIRPAVPAADLGAHGPRRRAGPAGGGDQAAAAEDGRFHMEGGAGRATAPGSAGYDTVLGAMERASSLFHERVRRRAWRTYDPRYRNALFHLLTAETSCYRYWGAGPGPTTAPSSPGASVRSSPMTSSHQRNHTDGQRVLCPGSQRAPALCWLLSLAVRA